MYSLLILTFFFVLFLLQNKHMMIEKLLQLFVGVIDTKLFESVEFKDFEAGDVENSNEKRAR